MSRSCTLAESLLTSADYKNVEVVLGTLLSHVGGIGLYFLSNSDRMKDVYEGGEMLYFALVFFFGSYIFLYLKVPNQGRILAL